MSLSECSILRRPDRIQLLTGGFRSLKATYLQDQSDVSVSFVPSEAGLKVLVSGTDTPIAFIKCRWELHFPIGTRFLGDAVERAYGNLQYEGMRPERIMPWYFAAAYKNEQAGFGVKVRPDAFVNWQADPSGVTLWLDLRCGTRGYCLNGETLCAAELVEHHSEETDNFAFLSAFCDKMADHPLLPGKPVYGFNNWYYAYGKITADGVLADTKLLGSLTDGIENRPYMVIDDGWQQEATVGCDTNEQFPDMAGLVRSMKAENVRPGIWIRPLKPKAAEFTDLRSQGCPAYLDPSRDEVLSVVAADMERITGEWGFELVKHDYSTFDIFGKYFFDPDAQMSRADWSLANPMTNAQAIKRLYQTIYEHSNGAVLIGCNCVAHLGCGYFHIHRSGDDTSGRDWERTRYMGINTLAFRLCQHKRFFEVDADCVGCTGDGALTWEMASRFLELLIDSKTALFVSIAPKLVTGEVRAQLHNAFVKASKQEGSFKPLDLTETTMPTRYEVDGIVKEYCFDDTMGAGIAIQ